MISIRKFNGRYRIKITEELEFNDVEDMKKQLELLITMKEHYGNKNYLGE